MDKTLTKIKDLEYNELVVLVVLHNDKSLLEIVKDDLKPSVNALITIAKNNELSIETKNVLRSFFDEIILTDSTVLKAYEGYLNHFNTSPNELIKSLREPEPVIEGKVIAPKEVVAEKKKPNRKLPRRIGKEAIEKTIKENGGKSTQVQRAMLRINDLKNLYVKLQARGIKEMYAGDGSVLTENECRAISSGISILEQKVKDILNK